MDIRKMLGSDQSCCKNGPEQRNHPQQSTIVSRKLRFAPYDDVLEIPHAKEMSQDDIQKLWISRDEYINAKNRTLTLGECLRGFTFPASDPDYPTDACLDRKQVYSVVQAVQKFEAAAGMDANHLMGNLCRKFSKNSVEEARLAALDHATSIIDELLADEDSDDKESQEAKAEQTDADDDEYFIPLK